MELYTATAYDTSRRLTRAYSTSFSKSITLFDEPLQPHIYAVYGLVRIADEIVDTYDGKNKAELLDELEEETYIAINRGYSPNPIVHAFALTAREYDIDRSIIRPFFESMAMDLEPKTYNKKEYERYIYGSAEVVGLMCLRIFVQGDHRLYGRLQKGAQALGAAYQKVNFLRDMAADYTDLGRVYFPGVEFDTFSDKDKARIVADIERDILYARKKLVRLPASSRNAVELSLAYYYALLKKLGNTPADVIKQQRIRISAVHKLALHVKTSFVRRFRRG